jgi:hypothetical protein
MDTEHSDSEEGSTSSDEDDLPGNVLSAGNLKSNMIESKFDMTDHKFLPDGILTQRVTKALIPKILGIDNPNEEDVVLVDFIETRARKLLAICAYIELRPLRKAMALFQQHNFDDHDLPIKSWSAKKLKSAAKDGTQHAFVIMEGYVDANTQDILWARHWSKIYDFQEAQCMFLAPIFWIEKDTPSQDVGKLILPFISKQIISREGAFGDVYQCEIHRDHIKDPRRPSEKV